MASTDCGWCGRLAHMQPVSGLITLPGSWGGAEVQAAYLCPNCFRINVAAEPIDDYVQGVHRGAASAADERAWGPYVQWLPKRGQQRDYPDVPQHVAEAATEATLCLSVGAYRAVGSLARAVMEATAKDKGANGRDLKARIDKLAELGHVREHTKEQAHEIRYFGNDMAHGDFADPTTEEDASEVIELMSEVLNEVYQSPAKLARVREARLAKKADQ